MLISANLSIKNLRGSPPVRALVINIFGALNGEVLDGCWEGKYRFLISFLGFLLIKIF